MHALMRRGLYVSLMVGGGILFCAGQASADEGTSGADSLLGGNQAGISVSVPVTVSGNSVAVIGDSSSKDSAASSGAGSATGGTPHTSGQDSAAGGNQVSAPVAVPVNLSGNSIAVVGDSSSSDSQSTSTAPTGSTGSVSSDGTTSGGDSVGGGNQAAAPVSVPMTVSGNSVAVIGDSSSTGSTGSTTSGSSGSAGSGSGSGSAGSGAGGSTSGGDSVAGGNQVGLPVTVPVTAGGNAVSGVGDATSSGADTSGTAGSGTTGGTTGGGSSVGGGNQVDLPVTVPITIGGNAGTIIGDATTEDPTTTTDPSDPGGGDPTDPPTPTSPTDPSDPTGPTNPGGGTDAGGSDTGGGGDTSTTGDPGVPTGSHAAASAIPVSVGSAPTEPSLAMTGSNPLPLLAAAVLLLLTGLRLRGMSRRPRVED